MPAEDPRFRRVAPRPERLRLPFEVGRAGRLFTARAVWLLVAGIALGIALASVLDLLQYGYGMWELTH